jgi:hypothetical protein
MRDFRPCYEFGEVSNCGKLFSEPTNIYRKRRIRDYESGNFDHLTKRIKTVNSSTGALSRLPFDIFSSLIFSMDNPIPLLSSCKALYDRKRYLTYHPTLFENFLDKFLSTKKEEGFGTFLDGRRVRLITFSLHWYTKKESVQLELDILNKLPNVLKSLRFDGWNGEESRDGTAKIVAEAGDQSLLNRLGEGPLTEEQYLKIAVNMCEFADAISQNPLFCGKLATYQIVIKDFNAKINPLSLLSACRTEYAHNYGNRQWMAPEVFGTSLARSSASDVFAIGIMLISMYTRTDPFSFENFHELKTCLENREEIEKLPNVFPADANTEFVNTIRSMVSFDPQDRPPIHKVFETFRKLLERFQKGELDLFGLDRGT